VRKTHLARGVVCPNAEMSSQADQVGQGIDLGIRQRRDERLDRRSGDGVNLDQLDPPAHGNDFIQPVAIGLQLGRRRRFAVTRIQSDWITIGLTCAASVRLSRTRRRGTDDRATC